ncbi:hypothetical protein D5S17_19230 [Pseudonocardiaceae bacterium YIM PH 21723]|nr:hypothetical protein D5S17_19230 [Pseudonocardiaceae bacterium YIM PH 21723]
MQRLINSVESGEVLELDGETVPAKAIRDLLRAGSADPRGVRIRGAVIEGQLDLTDLHSTVPLVLQDCRFTEPLLLTRAELPHLDLTGSTVPGISAVGFRCAHGAQLDKIRCTARIDLANARFGGTVSFSGATLSGGEHSALNLAGAEIDGILRLGPEFDASSTSEAATILAPWAVVSGQVWLTTGKIENQRGPCFVGELLVAKGGFGIDDFTMESASGLAALRMENATCNFVNLARSRITNSRGPAININNNTISGELLIWGSTLEGRSPQSAMLLRGIAAHSLSMNTLTSTNLDPDGVALDLTETRISHVVRFSLGSCELTPRLVKLAGFSYPAVPQGAGLDDWMDLLRTGMPKYRARPYQQLAAVYRAVGHEQDAKRILIAQQTDLRRRGDIGGPIRQALHWLSGVLIGYGHRPWRALICLLAVLALAGGVAFTGHAVHPRTTDRCTTVERVGLAADIAIPLVNAGNKGRCELAAVSPPDQAALGAAYLLQILGWAFATLFVAGYTGMVRKT